MNLKTSIWISCILFTILFLLTISVSAETAGILTKPAISGDSILPESITGILTQETEKCEACSPGTESTVHHKIMHFTEQEIQEHLERLSTKIPAPQASGQTIASTGQKSLLSSLQYTPSERDQGACGNCWVWAATGSVAISLNTQEQIKDRLSVQYLNSNYNGGTGMDWACCGGMPDDFVNFYTDMGENGGKKILVPWSNANADYHDASALCSASTKMPAVSIQAEPNYEIDTLSWQPLQTSGISQAQAIANIKQQIDNGKPVELGFYLPNGAAWDDFSYFWDYSSQQTMYDMTKFSGTEYNYYTGGSHAVLVTGYADFGGSGYWEILNCWGAPSNRPDGTFCIDMYKDYSATYMYGIPIMVFEIFNVEFDQPDSPPDASFTTSTDIGKVPLTVSFTDTSTENPTQWNWNFGDGQTATQQNPEHTYTQPGASIAQLTAANAAGSDTATATITVRPDADFTSNKVTGEAPLAVSFTDTSLGSPTSWNWNFGDGQTATQQNPEHTYAETGTYSVFLTVTAKGVSDTATKTDYITVTEQQIIAFPNETRVPTDPDSDGKYEDINGNGRIDFDDVVVYFNNLTWIPENEPVQPFDYNNNGRIDIDDVVELFTKLSL